MRRSWPAAAVALLALGGCATQDSANVRTAGISPTMRVQATSDGIDFSVRLGSGGLNTVKLDDGDSLTASAGGHRIALTGGRFLGVAGYGGHLDATGKPGTKVTIALQRTSKDTTAPNSTVTLPQAVTVSAPARDASVPRSRDLEIRVNDAPGALRVEWHGSCIDPTVTLPDFDRGTPVVVPADSIRRNGPTNGKASPSTCLMTLTVSRVLRGTLDPAYDGGSLESLRSTSVLVRSVP